MCSLALADGSDEPLDPGSQSGPRLSHQLTMAWHVPALLPALLPADFTPSPRTPLPRTASTPTRPGRMGWRRSRWGGKRLYRLARPPWPPRAARRRLGARMRPWYVHCVGRPCSSLRVALMSPPPRLGWQSCGTWVHPPPNPWGHWRCWGDGGDSCSIRSSLVSHPAERAVLAGLGCHQG